MILPDIVFPVYLVIAEAIKHGPSGAVFTVDRLGNTKLLDDKSLPGATLGLRRLSLKARDLPGIAIKPLRKIAWEYRDLIRLRKVYGTKARFIDTKGTIFKYDTNKYSKLKYYKITKIDILEGKHTYLYFSGLNTPIKVPRPPPEGVYYGGVIHSPVGNVLYTYSSEKQKDTVIKI